MAPITTYFLMFISSVFYVFWDARVAIEEFTVHDRFGFSIPLEHHDFPILAPFPPSFERHGLFSTGSLFVTAAEQVYYTDFPGGHRDWYAVIKAKARSQIIDNVSEEVDDAYQLAPHELNDANLLFNIDPVIMDETLATTGGEHIDKDLVSRSKRSRADLDTDELVQTDNHSDTETEGEFETETDTE
ncbi:hypothetical protein RJT34_24714 [Clitoria ternatea]|uniref:Uncharacterized protein n=1 Tax=Clitoria ternatea TaxID=43366 RepID=A0AAN9FV84_CLITE